MANLGKLLGIEGAAEAAIDEKALGEALATALKPLVDAVTASPLFCKAGFTATLKLVPNKPEGE